MFIKDKKNRKGLYLGLIAILFLIVLILPFLLTDTTNDKLRVISTLLSGICSSITLIIGILLFNRYGIDKIIIDKKRDIALDILQNIKDLTIKIEYKGGYIYYRPGTPHFDGFENYYKVTLIFSDSYQFGLDKILTHINSIYTPDEIIKKIKEIQPFTYAYIDAEKENSGKVFISGFQSNERFGNINGKEITFLDFINSWNILISETVEWLKKHSDEKIELNIED